MNHTQIEPRGWVGFESRAARAAYMAAGWLEQPEPADISTAKIDNAIAAELEPATTTTYGVPMITFIEYTKPSPLGAGRAEIGDVAGFLNADVAARMVADGTARAWVPPPGSRLPTGKTKSPHEETESTPYWACKKEQIAKLTPFLADVRRMADRAMADALRPLVEG